MTRLVSLVLAAALLGAFGVARAQESSPVADGRQGPAIVLGWNATLASDYVFRGVSQTDGGPALQGGVDLGFGCALYAGMWTTNVDFGRGGPDLEIDAFLGWNPELGDRLGLDLMLIRYGFLGESRDFGPLDYAELVATLEVDQSWTLTLGYTNDVYALGEDSVYCAVAGAWDVGRGVTLQASLGRTAFARGAGLRDYLDWSVAVGRDLGPVHAALGYHDSDGDGERNFGRAADARIVLILTVER